MNTGFGMNGKVSEYTDQVPLGADTLFPGHLGPGLPCVQS